MDNGSINMWSSLTTWHVRSEGTEKVLFGAFSTIASQTESKMRFHVWASHLPSPNSATLPKQSTHAIGSTSLNSTAPSITLDPLHPHHGSLPSPHLYPNQTPSLSLTPRPPPRLRTLIPPRTPVSPAPNPLSLYLLLVRMANSPPLSVEESSTYASACSVDSQDIRFGTAPSPPPTLPKLMLHKQLWSLVWIPPLRDLTSSVVIYLHTAWSHVDFHYTHRDSAPSIHLLFLKSNISGLSQSPVLSPYGNLRRWYFTSYSLPLHISLLPTPSPSTLRSLPHPVPLLHLCPHTLAWFLHPWTSKSLCWQFRLLSPLEAPVPWF